MNPAAKKRVIVIVGICALLSTSSFLPNTTPKRSSAINPPTKMTSCPSARKGAARTAKNPTMAKRSIAKAIMLRTRCGEKTAIPAKSDARIPNVYNAIVSSMAQYD